MENFTIETITGRKMNRANDITVDSISHSNKEENTVEKIIETKEKKRELLADFMNNQYENCSRKLHIANQLGKTDLLFSVPAYEPEIPAYSSLSCLVYIEKRLRELCYDTIIINKTTIFITWVYIEVNLNEQKRQKYKQRQNSDKNN